MIELIIFCVSDGDMLVIKRIISAKTHLHEYKINVESISFGEISDMCATPLLFLMLYIAFKAYGIRIRNDYLPFLFLRILR